MADAKRQYAYFENLEKTIKFALAIYIFLLLTGIGLLAAGSSETVFAFWKRSIVQSALLAVSLTGAYALLFSRVNKISWLGDLHIWLDRKIFGFLSRSNEIIFRTMLFALRPAERDSAYELSAQYVIDHWNAVFPTGDCTTKFGYSLLEHAEEKR